MSAKISRQFHFYAAIYFDELFSINAYNIDLTMIVITEDMREQNVALDRIKFLLNECLENTVFIYNKETKIIDLYSKAGLKLCLLPEEPYDQVVGAVLLHKFNAVLENRLYISELKIQSLICDNILFYISSDDEIDFIKNTNGWYMDSSPRTSENFKRTKKEKVVELKKEMLDWNTIGLNWKEKLDTKDSGEIVFIPLDK